MEKCTFCAQLVSQDMKPACCSACPGNARIFGDMDDSNSDIRTYLSDKKTYTLGDEYNTEPNVYYIAASEKNQVNVLGASGASSSDEKEA